MIRFVCHHCQSKVSAPEGKSGRWAPCPCCATPLQVPLIQDYLEAPPPVPETVEEIMIEGSPLPSSSWWLRWLWIGCLIVLLGFVLWQLPSVLYPEHRIVGAYLKQHLHDPRGMEVIRWGDLKPVWFEDGAGKKRGLFLSATIRSRTSLGSQKLTEFLFILHNNQVVRSQEVRELYRSLGAPPEWDYKSAIQQLGIDY